MTGVWVNFAIGLSVALLVGVILVEIGSRRLKKRRREVQLARDFERRQRRAVSEGQRRKAETS